MPLSYPVANFLVQMQAKLVPSYLVRLSNGRQTLAMVFGKLTFPAFLSVCIAACIVFSLSAKAGQFDQTTLYLNYLPHRLTETSGQQYDRLLEELIGDDDRAVFRQAVPLARGKALFLPNPDACLFPTNILALRIDQNAYKLLVSETVDIVSLRLYTARSSTSFASVTDFDPRRVGFISGSGAIQSLPNSDQFVAIPSEKQLIAMLELGRLDAFLGHHPDTALALDHLGKPDALHVSPITIKNLRFPVTFICHDTAVGRTFISEINKRIAAVHKSGRLRDILGPHADLPELKTAENTEDMTR